MPTLWRHTGGRALYSARAGGDGYLQVAAALAARTTTFEPLIAIRRLLEACQSCIRCRHA